MYIIGGVDEIDVDGVDGVCDEDEIDVDDVGDERDVCDVDEADVGDVTDVGGMGDVQLVRNEKRVNLATVGKNPGQELSGTQSRSVAAKLPKLLFPFIFVTSILVVLWNSNTKFSISVGECLGLFVCGSLKPEACNSQKLVPK